MTNLTEEELTEAMWDALEDMGHIDVDSSERDTSTYEGGNPKLHKFAVLVIAALENRRESIP